MSYGIIVATRLYFKELYPQLGTVKAPDNSGSDSDPQLVKGHGFDHRRTGRPEHRHYYGDVKGLHRI